MDSLRICLYLSFVTAVFSYQANNVQHMEIIDIGARGEKGGLIYNPCNVTAVPIYLKKLTINPDLPIKYGSFMALTAELDISENITGKIGYDVEIMVKLNGEYDNLCDLLHGYCHGDNACKYLEKLPYCPSLVKHQGSNCSCPFQENAYKFSNVPIVVPKFQFTITGDFNITLKLHRRVQGQEQQLMCANVRFCLENCDS